MHALSVQAGMETHEDEEMKRPREGPTEEESAADASEASAHERVSSCSFFANLKP